MRTEFMGKVEVPAKIESLEDLFAARQGQLSPDKVRHLDVPDALVETGASLLSLPKRFVQQLGLRFMRTRVARTATGAATFDVYEAVRLTVQGRDCTIDVAQIPDECPVVIGVIPLELLDFVVDPVGQRLIGNPAHGGKHMIDMF